jgi:2-deoxy-D-gluconate 3-dehydrogenase
MTAVNDTSSIAGPFSLAGKTAVVTGCRRGIGRAAAVALADAGADLIGVSASLESDGGDVGREVQARGRSFRGYRCDFADRAAVHALIADLQRDVPRIDVLVNNAGTIARAPAAEHGDELWDRVLEVNLSAQFVLTRELGKRMLKQRSGKIVFVASMLSFQGGVNVPGYAASKSGIAALTKALANEWAARGVNVNAVAPGYIRTDNTQALQDDPVRSVEILSRIPAGRWGRPDDLTGAIVFLSCAASDYVSGAILPIDGGWLAR